MKYYKVIVRATATVYVAEPDILSEYSIPPGRMILVADAGNFGIFKIGCEKTKNKNNELLKRKIKMKDIEEKEATPIIKLLPKNNYKFEAIKVGSTAAEMADVLRFMFGDQFDASSEGVECAKRGYVTVWDSSRNCAIGAYEGMYIVKNKFQQTGRSIFEVMSEETLGELFERIKNLQL